jgi:hypothetical protein
MPEIPPLKPAPALSGDEGRALRAVVALMIPASAEFGMPGADDDAIFADIAGSLGRDADAVKRALQRLDAIAGGPFADLPAAAQSAAVERFRAEAAALAGVLVAVTVRCYYRDDRVMRAIGMEVRAPFPKGFEVEAGDWSLLDPVRARGPIYREAP